MRNGHTQGLETFYPVTSSVYSLAENNNTQAQLTCANAGTSSEQFMLTSAQGTQSVFNGLATGVAMPGRLQSITDRYGNKQTLAWTNVGGVDQLSTVTDSYGRVVNYAYYGSEQRYQLQQITDFLGRQLNFQYDAGGNLAAVVTPSILQAAAGNTFPGGTAYVFQYDLYNPRADRREDLIRIWYPNEAAPFLDADTRTVDLAGIYASGAPPRYSVEYGQDPTDTNSYGMVTSETIGDPENGVGGTYYYQYELYDDVTPPTNIIDAEDPIVLRCTMTDRNGNQTIHDFNANQMAVHLQVVRNRSKIDIPALTGSGSYASYDTWTKYNDNNQPSPSSIPRATAPSSPMKTAR